MNTVGIVTYKINKPWDPDSVKTGITGSEEAVIYLAEQLSRLGVQVIVYGDPPRGSPHSAPHANPRYLDLSFLPQANLDIAVAWRMPRLGRMLRSIAQRVYLWPHDPTNEHLSIDETQAFDDVLWLSHWQRAQWISLSPSLARFTKIFGNGVNPEQMQAVGVRDNPYSCIYGSNYAFGLEVLFDIWPFIKAQFPRATLDIYYSWQSWGILSPAKEAKMRALLRQLEGVREHGLVSHQEISQAYARASFWTYPCIFKEVFCISALRAQLSGAVPVIIDGSAFVETVRHGYKCHRPEEYYDLLVNAMRGAEMISLDQRKAMGQFVLEEFTWKKVASKWKELFFRETNH